MTFPPIRRLSWLRDVDLLVAYDVNTADLAGQRRLARVAKVCERYGTRVQYSVFECRLDEILYQSLISELDDEIDASVDSIRIYRLGMEVAKSRFTMGVPPPDWAHPMIL